MNEINLSCAPADRRQWNNWTDIDWVRCEAAVQKLQGRIVKAQKEGRPGKVKALAMDIDPLVLRQSVGGQTSYL